MTSFGDVKNAVERLNEFWQRRAQIVAPIHELPQAIERRNRVRTEVVALYQSVAGQLCVDNNFPQETSVYDMPETTVVSATAEKKFHAIVDYLKVQS